MDYPKQLWIDISVSLMPARLVLFIDRARAKKINKLLIALFLETISRHANKVLPDRPNWRLQFTSA